MKLSCSIIYIVLLLFLSACTPCRQVEIESYPPGAAISILSSPGFDSRDLPPLESWSLLGHTPLTVSGCRLNDEIKADWEGREIFFPEYHGSGRILFNFEEEKVKEE